MSIRDILSETHGRLIYAEQLMLILKEEAGFDLKEVEVVRKSMAKKQTHKLAVYKKQFMTMSKHEAAEQLWDSLVDCAGYLFNRSHVLAYKSIYEKGEGPYFEHAKAVLEVQGFLEPECDTPVIVEG